MSRSVALLAAASLGASGCATMAPPEQLTEATAKFSEVVKNSSETLTAEVAAKTAVRRDEMIMYHLANGDNISNLTRKAVPKSFANYVCVGSSSLLKQQAFLEYSKSYSDTLAGIAKAGGSGFAEQMKKYNALKKSAKAEIKESEAPAPANAFNDCVSDVSSKLEFSGVMAADFSNESPLTAILGLEELLKSVEALAASGLKIANDLEARRQFSSLVKAQHYRFKADLGKSFPDEMLDNAWERRKARALWRPYRQFMRMMELDPLTRRDEIVSASEKINAGLAEYDALRKTKSPSMMVEALRKAEDALYAVATDENLSPREVVSFLSALSTDIEHVKEAYKKADKAAGDHFGG